MRRIFRFLWMFSWPNLATLAGFAVVIVLGASLTGVPQGADNIFATYFPAFPFMELMVLYAVSFALCTTNLNLAVSFGCRRRDFFWGYQGMLAVYTGISWLLKEGMYRLPAALGWPQGSRLDEMAQMMNLRGILFPALALCLLALGAVSGLVFARSKVWGTVVIVAAAVLGMGVFFLFMILNLTEHSALLGRLATVTLAVMAAAFAAAEVFLWRFTGRYCVR